ncbi:MAG: helix-turn-helix domain-containing protein [Chloroflexia bacterium]
MAPVGDTLRERREERGLTLDDVSRQTRIRREYLEALESSQYDRLPADVYVRGFLRAYAQLLGLDPTETVRAYEKERGTPELVSIAPVSTPPRVRSCVLPSVGIVLFATLAMLAFAIWAYYGWLHPTTIPPTATPRPPTATPLPPTFTPQATPPTAGPTATPRIYRGLEAVFQVSAPCWVRVIADGVQVFQGTLPEGSTRTFTATQELQVRFGNAGGVRVILNGQDLGVQGNPGQVVNRTWRVEQ